MASISSSHSGNPIANWNLYKSTKIFYRVPRPTDDLHSRFFTVPRTFPVRSNTLTPLGSPAWLIASVFNTNQASACERHRDPVTISGAGISVLQPTRWDFPESRVRNSDDVAGGWPKSWINLKRNWCLGQSMLTKMLLIYQTGLKRSSSQFLWKFFRDLMEISPQQTDECTV